MTELEIVDKILAILFGGEETTTAAITFAMKYLSEMPHLYNEVLKGIFQLRSIPLRNISICLVLLFFFLLFAFLMKL